AEESRLIAQRGRTDLLVRATKAGLLDWDTVQDRVSFSERYKEMFGFGEAPDAAMPGLREMLHPEDRDRAYGGFLSQLRDRRVRGGLRQYQPQDFRMRRTDGHYIWVHAEATCVCGADGRTLRFICSFIDISASKRHEQEMENRAKFIDDLFDSVPLGLALRDAQGRYLVVNRTWERYVGLSRESVIGTCLADVDDPFARATLERDRQALALGADAQGPAQEYDYQGRRYMQTRTVMADAQGQRIGVLAASLDITEKHQAEQALATERERLRLLVRSTNAGFGDWNARRDMVIYDERFKEMLGWPADADTSRWPSIFEMMHPDDREGARERFRLMIQRRGGAAEQSPGEAMSYRLRRRDGRYIWIHAEGISQVDEEGRTLRFITSYLDVTALREQERALRASRDQIAAQAAQLELQNETLKENVRLREEVERIGRHDLKTPLNSIVAVPRLLREERRLGPEADELLGIVERAGYRILSMVNLSLDLYKIEQGSYVLRPDAVDLADLVGKVVADVRMHAASKQVLLQLDVESAPYAWAEELLCYSLLANLVKNAVEAAPEGGVVRLQAQACEAGVQLRIHNQGCVPQALRANFFGKYATLGKASGTGLGTYSARLMARVQDGEIRMETSEQDGTTLTVQLRAAPAGAVPATARHVAERREAEPTPIDALPAIRVLLVDDDEYNLLIVRRFLPSPPFTVDTAINGKVALAAAELQWPDVIFMDLDMPVMGGLHAARELRALERATLARRCTMVALSSHDDQQTRELALAAGFDRYLTKPVTRELIHETLLELHTLIGEAPAPAPILTRSSVPAMHDPVIADPDVEPVLGQFLVSRRGLIADMARAMSAGDRGEVRRISHQLAGSFGLYGFHWASEQSRWIEKNFSEVDDAELDRMAGELRHHLDTVQVVFGPAG
ncbi:MAG TPA: PAS domain S-box protein, partial [Solimonas sp.]|nr:PAS domain S-box protein [Solimonas sp.]